MSAKDIDKMKNKIAAEYDYYTLEQAAEVLHKLGKLDEMKALIAREERLYRQIEKRRYFLKQKILGFGVLSVMGILPICLTGNYTWLIFAAIGAYTMVTNQPLISGEYEWMEVEE